MHLPVPSNRPVYERNTGIAPQVSSHTWLYCVVLRHTLLFVRVSCCQVSGAGAKPDTPLFPLDPDIVHSAFRVLYSAFCILYSIFCILHSAFTNL